MRDAEVRLCSNFVEVSSGGVLGIPGVSGGKGTLEQWPCEFGGVVLTSGSCKVASDSAR